ncbi:MAG: hypothetical protein ABI459_07070 [Deltaproteobacteria bacterium]
MSFDLVTKAFVNGRAGPGNRDGLAGVFRRYTIAPPDEFGCSKLHLGPEVYNFYGPKLREPETTPLDCLISIEGGLSPDLLTFLFDLCTSCEMVLILQSDDAFDGATVLCPATVDPAHLPSDEIFTHPVIWTSPDQAAERLRGAFSAFDAYRSTLPPAPDEPGLKARLKGFFKRFDG